VAAGKISASFVEPATSGGGVALVQAIQHGNSHIARRMRMRMPRVHGPASRSDR
jgi:hypothetical protein